MFQRILILAALLTLAALAQAQTFDSGSTGVDGALTFPASAGTIIFDPATLNPPLAADHGPIYNFITITIPVGTNVKLTHRVFTGHPVTWLAQEAVQIGGSLVLDGEAGAAPNNFNGRTPALPGPGGFFGGAGGNSTAARPPTPGLGPGGGAAAGLDPGGGGAARAAAFAKGGTFTGNSFLVPLFGGSGGGGGLVDSSTSVQGGGGGGGGALLLASSDSITILNGGAIVARGGGAAGPDTAGNSCPGGGSGGAIRLMAPKIQGNGLLSVGPGVVGCGGSFAPVGSNGLVRIEAFQHLYTFQVIGGPPVTSAPFNTFVTSSPPSVRVVSVGGVPVNPSPTGTFEVPDVTFDSAAQVPVVIEAKKVPLTAAVKLQIFSDDAADQNFDAPALTGTLDLSNTTVNVTFPTGFSRGFLRATFTAAP